MGIREKLRGLCPSHVRKAEPLAPGLERTGTVLVEVRAERERQEEKWGQSNHLPTEWITILAQELGEAAQAANRINWPRAGAHGVLVRRAYRTELVQVAAVAVAAVESLDRGLWDRPPEE